MKEPVDIDQRIEPFVDDWLVESMSGVELRLQEPVRGEVVLTHDVPWEGPLCAYHVVVRDGDRVRLYYRGFMNPRLKTDEEAQNQYACVAESDDGIHFERPSLGLVEFGGSRDNNIIWRGEEAHNFAAFIDTNPDAPSEERYKAVGGCWRRLFGLASSDGIHWHRMREEPLAMTGAFDSLNVVWWDEPLGCYRCYSRHFMEHDGKTMRVIQSATSQDFFQWTEPRFNQYAPNIPLEHFYTNATVPCPGSPHILLAFPKRFHPGRTRILLDGGTGVSDAVFMSSRDGVHWDRPFMEGWVRPGPDPQNWTHRNNMTAWGIVETGPAEWSMYISEHYGWNSCRLRRLTLRAGGLASVHANWSVEGGQATTRPLCLTADSARVWVNFATSGAGWLRAEVQDVEGRPLPGFAFEDMEPLYGDAIDEPLAWKGGSNLATLLGHPVRLSFRLLDADLFALRFTPAGSKARRPSSIQSAGSDALSQSSAAVTVKPNYHWDCVTPNAPFAPRDGAGLLPFHGRLWLLGGWNPYDREHFPRQCNNEVWSTADGLDWRLELKEAPWEPRHTAGYVVHRDRMWIVGGDPTQGHYQNDVWSSNDGTNWECVTDAVPWQPRALHHTVCFDDRIWVMGGQTLPQFAAAEETFYNDVWNSTDGLHWERVTEHAPWSTRGMIGGSAVFNGRLWLPGGGTYRTPATPPPAVYSQVWSTADGVEWRNDTQRAAWEPRAYHEVAVWDNQLWVLEGHTPGVGNRNDVWHSADGSKWHEVASTPWPPRHAASVAVFDDALWVIAGAHMTSDVWKLVRDS